MQKILKKTIQIIFMLLLLLIVIYNFLSIGLGVEKISIGIIIFTPIILSILYLNERKVINKNFIKIPLIILFIAGILIRLFLISNLDFNLASDFKFYYDQAQGILNGQLPNPLDLSYNGYAFIFASVLAGLFYFFGSSVGVVLIFNLLCQILTSYLLYQILKKRVSESVGLLGATFWFLFPNVIFANLLVSTETVFMLMFTLTFYMFFEIFDRKKEYKNDINKYLTYILFGIMISITNGLRPVMLIFIIAIVIYYLLKSKKLAEYLTLALILISYFATNFLFNMYIENGIGRETRSGAVGWSIFYGSNYDTCGSWNIEDGKIINQVLSNNDDADKTFINKTVERYKDLGLSKSLKLVQCKFTMLWTDVVSTYHFVIPILADSSAINLSQHEGLLINLGKVLFLSLCFIVLIASFLEWKRSEYHSIFIQIFAIGYILANLVIVLNGRYNFPIYLLLVIIAAQFFNFFRASRAKNYMNATDTIKYKGKPKVLLIIPAYNEEKNIEKTCNSIINSKGGYDFVVINDGSTDNTALICENNKYNHINLVNNLGIGGAVQTGYKYALDKKYDIAVQFDGDGQHDINYVENLVKLIKNGEADFVVGSRFIDNSSEFKSTRARRFGIKIISFFIYALTNQKITDPTSGFRATNRKGIELFANNYPIEYPEPESFVELFKKNFVVKEIPVKMHERKEGKSSISPLKSFYYMFNVVISILVISLRREK